MTDHPTSADAAAAGMDALGRAMSKPSITDGLADREFAMPGPDLPNPDLGELARPFAEKWFHIDSTRERCVGAIRDFVLSSTFREWYKGVGR